jgi:GH18 family chitinase
MITRAGIPANKVTVGVASYGRSFEMAEKGCTGPMCTFLGGPKEGDSPARPGPCIDTGGYISNAEIDMIVAAAGGPNSDSINMWYDSRTMTDYLVHDDVEWVAYMTLATKFRRTQLYALLNFGGITDWAVDLETFGKADYMTPGVFLLLATEGGCTWTFGDGMTCSHPAIKDASMEKGKRWDELHVGCAWRNMTRAWVGAGRAAGQGAVLGADERLLCRADGV